MIKLIVIIKGGVAITTGLKATKDQSFYLYHFPNYHSHSFCMSNLNSLSYSVIMYYFMTLNNILHEFINFKVFNDVKLSLNIQ